MEHRYEEAIDDGDDDCADDDDLNRSHRSTVSTEERFRRFCERVLGLRLEPFQRLILREFFAGRRELLVLIPRGNGKTTLFAALALFHLLTEPQPAVYVAAAGRDQARLTFEIARRFARHPLIEGRVTPRFNELRVADGFLRILSSDAPRAHGLQPTLALVDELHAHANPDLYVALKTALGKREDSRLITISTAGYARESVLGKLRERALSLPDIERGGTLTVARSPAFAMLEWAIPEDADASDPKALKAANPASFVSLDFLREQVESPGLHALEVARYHGNRWTDAAAEWLPAGAWAACGADYTVDEGSDLWLGIDIGGTRSASAIVGVDADLRVAIVRVYQGEDAVLKVTREVRELAGRFALREIAFDPWRYQGEALRLEEDGLTLVEFPQSHARMTAASEELHAAITEGRLRHPGDPDLDRHVAAAVAEPTGRGWRLTKATRGAQIDALIALCLAVARASCPAPTPEIVSWL